MFVFNTKEIQICRIICNFPSNYTCCIHGNVMYKHGDVMCLKKVN